MRGFTMLLVVMSHVSLFCLESAYRTYTFHKVLSEFSMPLFFFVSGFVLYKDQHWNLNSIISFLKKKILILIITPAIFMFVYLYIKGIPWINAISQEYKVGYWFTFMLFEYFCFYILLFLLGQALRLQKYDHIIIGITSLLVYVFTSSAMLERINLNKTTQGVLGIGQWGMFFFFWMGICVRTYFLQFQKLLDGFWLVPVSITLFFVLNIFNGICPIHTLRILFCQLTGVIIVFAFFRHYQQSFSSQTIVGTTLQYIGKRTLDIYLLHYFFLPVNLKEMFPYFSKTSIPALEFVVSFMIAVIVVIFCLIIGNVLRINPKMEYWMWGTKSIPNKR